MLIGGSGCSKGGKVCSALCLQDSVLQLHSADSYLCRNVIRLFFTCIALIIGGIGKRYSVRRMHFP